MRKILFPTDFSESANNALAYAAKFASGNNAELVLYNASKLLEPVSLENTHEQLNIVAKEVRDAFEISCSTIAEPGGISLSDLIGRESSGYDLVIMGTNGADDLIQFLNGSNAFNTILKSKVPVLVIPVEFTDEEVSNVVYAFDYYNEQRLPVGQLLPWLKAIGSSELTVLQVFKEASQSLVGQGVEKLRHELASAKEPVGLKFDAVYSDSALALSINQYMIRAHPSVLCLCTQSRSFMEGLFHKSVIKDITAIASYPLFVFHG